MKDEVLQQTLQTKRGYLCQLMAYAYGETQKDNKNEKDKTSLEALGHANGSLPYMQAHKYHRYQFILPPLHEPFNDAPDDIYNLFIACFVKPEAAYEALRQEHPDGVDCWVNPEDALHAPLLESNLATSADSLLVAGLQLLDDISPVQDEKYNRIRLNILNYRDKIDGLIRHLYTHVEPPKPVEQSFFSRLFGKKPKSAFDEDYEQAYKHLLNFQRLIIAQLTHLETETPKKSDYKQMAKRLARLEQAVKPRQAPLQEKKHKNELIEIDELDKPRPIDAALQFNQDLFVMHLGQEAATYQYHDRHYYLTESQASRLELEAGQSLATATAHNPEFIGSNHAWSEEGCTTDDGLKLNHMGFSNGSHAPSEYYKASDYNKHTAALYALNNMEQTLIVARVKLLEGLLNGVVDDQPITKQTLALLASNLQSAHHAYLVQGDPVNYETLINSAELALPVAALEILHTNEARLVNPCNVHNHLITPSGLGSLSENQYKQFRHARLAQYATQSDEGGMIYMANGVNALRRQESSLVKGNNDVAMVALYQLLPPVGHNIKLDTLYKRRSDETRPLGNFNKALQATREAARAYFKAIKEGQAYQGDQTLSELLNQFEEHEAALREAATKVLPLIQQEFNNPNIILNDEAKLFKLILNLHRNEGHALGWSPWKKQENNGIMQALIQVLSDELNCFASVGCKSANDRKLFVSLLVSEIKKIPLAELNEQQFDEARRLKIRRAAMAQLSSHISNLQTQKDRSSVPKTNDKILIDGQKVLAESNAKLKERLKLSKFAAHKRKAKLKVPNPENMALYANHGVNDLASLLRVHWLKNPMSADYPALTQHIKEEFHGFKKDETMSKQYTKTLDDVNKYHPNPNALPLMKSWLTLHAHALGPDSENVADNLNLALVALKEKFSVIEGDFGQGFKQMQQLLVNFKVSDKPNLYALINLTMKLQTIAEPRTHDWTNAFAQCGLFKTQKRPEWLRTLYANLSQPITSANAIDFLNEVNVPGPHNEELNIVI